MISILITLPTSAKAERFVKKASPKPKKRQTPKNTYNILFVSATPNLNDRHSLDMPRNHRVKDIAVVCNFFRYTITALNKP